MIVTKCDICGKEVSQFGLQVTLPKGIKDSKTEREILIVANGADICRRCMINLLESRGANQ